MNRMSRIEIGGIMYPVNYSIRASRMVSEYNSQSHILEDFPSMWAYNLHMLYLMMEDAAKHLLLTESREITVPKPEDLEVMLQPIDAERVQNAIREAVMLGSKQEIKSAPVKNEVAVPE